MAVELEALRLGRRSSAGRDGHRDRRCPRRGRNASLPQGRPSAHFIVGAADKGQALDCATAPRFLNPRHEILPLLLAAASALPFATSANGQPIDPKVQARIDRILKATPLIDGHNDLAEQLARELQAASTEGLASGTDRWNKPLMTDMARLHQGRVGGQFWSVFIPAEVGGDRAIRDTLEADRHRQAVHRRLSRRPRAGVHRRRHRPHPQGRQGRLADRDRGRPPDRRTASPRFANSTISARAT